jgi:oligopeptidase B
VKRDGYYYYARTEKDKQYAIYCRKQHTLENPEQIILDVNALAVGQAYLRVGALSITPDHHLLAYAVDTDGSERYTWFIKDLNSGALLAESAAGCGTSLEWSSDGRFLFYSRLDHTLRPYQLYRHALGEHTARDTLLYEEPDEAFLLSLYKTKSRRFLVLSLHSNTTSEAHLLRADEPEGTFRVVQPRRPHLEYTIQDHEDAFYILTNDQAQNFRLMRTTGDALDKAHWQEIIAHRPAVKLDGMDVFKDFLVVYEREAGLTQVRIIEHAAGQDHRIAWDEPIFCVWEGENPEYEADTLRIGYSSLVTPDSVYAYHMRTRECRLLKREVVLGGYDASLYRMQRCYATSRDGTQVPISLVYRADRFRPRGSPCLMDGYGAYGISIDPHFSSARLGLLDRGFVCAIAHVRGGGYLGRAWYEQGKLKYKQNTFDDFIACAEELIKQGYTTPQQLAIQGGSAGGMLIGAVINQRPDLFQAAIAHVPFVDVLNTMLDESIPLTVIEYEEWGNPHRKEDFETIYAYAPYEQVAHQGYPHVLVTSGLNDPRVQYWEPAKWVAKLRAFKTDSNLLLLKTLMGAGHSGASGRYDHFKDVAFEFAFLFKALGLPLNGAGAA